MAAFALHRIEFHFQDRSESIFLGLVMKFPCVWLVFSAKTLPRCIVNYIVR